MWGKLKTWFKNLSPIKTVAVLGTFLGIGWSLSRAAKHEKRVKQFVKKRDAELVKASSDATERSAVHAAKANEHVEAGREAKAKAIEAAKELTTNAHKTDTVDDFLDRYNAKQRLRK